MKTSLLFTFLLLALSAAQGGTALPITTEFGAKSTVPAGVEVSLNIPQKVKLGDAIPGVFTVKNTSSVPFQISYGGDYRGAGFPLRLKIRVTDSRGSVLPDETINLSNLGGLSGLQEIGPGGTFEIKFPLLGYVAFPGEGVYTVEACHDLGWRVDEKSPHPVAKANLEMIMPSAEEVVARVRDLCRGSDPDQSFLLDKLRHDIFLAALTQEAQVGHASAVTGIAGIRGVAALKALIDLLESPSPEVVKAAGGALRWRLPDLGDPAKSAFSSWKDDDLFLHGWDPKFRGPLLNAALTMLRSKDAATVELGASFIQAQGDSTQAKPLLDATQTALDGPWEIRSGKGANTLDPPSPLRGLIEAIDALRGRGWRLGLDPDGGTAVILAQFRELSDPTIPRPGTDRWKQTVLSFADANPPTLRQNALLAIPTPVPPEFEPALMNALNDKDWGVLRSACEVAGKSGRVAFIRPLCNIVETTHETFVQSAASSSAHALGARVELWEAWCEVITDQEFMHEALWQLTRGTLDVSSGSSSGNSNFTREQRFSIRNAWREFIRTNHDRLARGERLLISDPIVSSSLTGSDFNAHDPAIRFPLPDGNSWPPAPAK